MKRMMVLALAACSAKAEPTPPAAIGVSIHEYLSSRTIPLRIVLPAGYTEYGKSEFGITWRSGDAPSISIDADPGGTVTPELCASTQIADGIPSGSKAVLAHHDDAAAELICSGPHGAVVLREIPFARTAVVCRIRFEDRADDDATRRAMTVCESMAVRSPS
jgi:hypothetical protein